MPPPRKQTRDRAARLLGAVLVVVGVASAIGCAPSTGGSEIRYVDGGPRNRRDAGSHDGAGGAHDGGRADARLPTMCSRSAPFVCAGDYELRCNADGSIANTRNCSSIGQTCVPDRGCLACVPSTRRCDGERPMVCRTDGSGYDPEAACDATSGEACDPDTGRCVSPCAEAEASSSYIGCDYWPIVTLNSEVPPEFSFAVVVANPHDTAATVTITRGASTVGTRTIAAHALETIALPWVSALKGAAAATVPSVLVRGGAYHLRSTLPVTVYQFNALEYRLARDCADMTLDDPGDGQCFSYSNDASLLLPAHVLTGNYMVVARPSLLTVIHTSRGLSRISSPGFFAIAGVEATPVTVQITFRAAVQAAADGSVRAFRAGETGSFTLSQGDVLEIASQVPSSCPVAVRSETVGSNTFDYCPLGDAYDLTGSEIRASGKVAVMSGHNCDFVPHDRWACDHLEQQMFPLETWGQNMLVAITQPLRSEPNIVRILSSHDGNAVQFDPAVHAPITLGRGQYVEVTSTSDFRVTGSDALLVTQFLVGQDYAGTGSSGPMGVGDPSMALGIPTEQFRSTYTFLAPLTYEMSFVNVTATDGQTVTLDGHDVSGWRSVGATGMRTARVSIAGGVHTVQSTSPFGILVYGFGSYTSYAYPGGLDLTQIDVPF